LFLDDRRKIWYILRRNDSLMGEEALAVEAM
jgi:hypothetical protein